MLKSRVVKTLKVSHIEPMCDVMRFLTIVVLLFLTAPARAYQSTANTGDMLNPGSFRAIAETQFLTSSGGGINASGRLDMGIDEELEVRGLLGLGKTDFFFGTYLKWIPIPDFEKQPALGASFGILYGRDGRENELTFRVDPLASKRFTTSFGALTPYAALPFGIRTESKGNKTKWPLQATLGTQVELEQLRYIRFGVEAGFDLNDSTSYVSLLGILLFDSEGGIQFR